MNMEDALADSTDDLELERIKTKISSAYVQMLSQVFKVKHPVGSPEELEKYLGANELKFQSDAEDHDSGTEELMEMLDMLLKGGEGDNISPVAEEQKKKLLALKNRRNKGGSLGGLFNL